MVLIGDLEQLVEQVQSAYAQLGISDIKKEAAGLQDEMNNPDFWSDSDRAQMVSKKHAQLLKRAELWEELVANAQDALELFKLNDASLFADIEKQYTQTARSFEAAKRELLFSGPYDDSDVIMSIFAGAGGVDAQDWAEMLLRMYTRFAESHDLNMSTIDQSSGDEAGIKSVTFQLSGGDFLYGKLKSENGVHRLVRLSPFNADSLRQTSFARVEVMPKIDSPTELEIDEKDLKIDVYRSGGKGGQSVNTTDSAVRITHIPTNIVVAIQNERSQLQNKETAMTILRSKLAQLQLEQHKDAISELKGPNEQAAWGNQIRNYVLHPYTMVKDTRTKAETTDTQAVLDGDIQLFIDAYLDAALATAD